jgi:acyl carrier protein
MGLALFEVVIVVEDAFGIPIPDEDMSRIPTPAALVDYLLEKLAPKPEARFFQAV